MPGPYLGGPRRPPCRTLPNISPRHAAGRADTGVAGAVVADGVGAPRFLASEGAKGDA